MKKMLKFAVLLFAIFLFTGCGNDNKYIKEITYDEYVKMIEEEKTFALEIWATGCINCEELKPKLEQFTEEYKVTIYSIDQTTLKDKELEEFKKMTDIEGTPTILFYQKGKEETVSARCVGSVAYDKIVEKFRSSGMIQ